MKLLNGSKEEKVDYNLLNNKDFEIEMRYKSSPLEIPNLMKKNILKDNKSKQECQLDPQAY